MKIAGLQKVSTIDYPGEIAAIVFLWGCNFRCGFCYNPDLVTKECDDIFSEEYVLDFLSKRVGKLDAVCITGGEPLMMLDMEFVLKIKKMGFKIKLDTNGSFPDRLSEMIKEGLVDYIAMDVKGAREDYEGVVGVDVDLGKIEESMKIVNDFGKKKIEPRMNANEREFLKDEKGENSTRTNADKRGQVKSEFRTTVVPGLHDLEKLRKMGEWMGEVCGERPGRIFLQGFKVNKEGMIDSSFLGKRDFLEGDLVRIREGVLDLFGEVGLRV